MDVAELKATLMAIPDELMMLPSGEVADGYLRAVTTFHALMGQSNNMYAPTVATVLSQYSFEASMVAGNSERLREQIQTLIATF